MKIGVIADDFTGASDIALTLAEGGMPTTQYIGVPEGAADAGVAAGVVALKSRTAPVGEAIAQSLAACRWLRDQGAEQIVLKVCSTFDSTQDGNIGPVLDALVAELRAGPVMVCPAFPENGRSVYQGHLFVGDVLLNESGMQNHPLTPMKDADLRRVLAAQSSRDVGHVPASVVQRGAEAIEYALIGQDHVIVDAISDGDLFAIGLAARELPLLCGGSGIALGLPGNFDYAPASPGWEPVRGKGVVLSGSCSIATRGQVVAYGDAPSREINAKGAVGGAYDIGELADWVMAQEGVPLVYSSADPKVVRAAQAKFGTEAAAEAIEGVFSALAAELVARGVRRIVVAGGETSGAVVTGIGARDLVIGPRAAAGVPLVRSSEGVALALKSGNFGGPDFFAEALDLMERAG